jgi:hypothetical protein
MVFKRKKKHVRKPKGTAWVSIDGDIVINGDVHMAKNEKSKGRMYADESTPWDKGTFLKSTNGSYYDMEPGTHQVVMILEDSFAAAESDWDYPKQKAEIVFDFANVKNVGKVILINVSPTSQVYMEGWEKFNSLDVGKMHKAWMNFLNLYAKDLE